MLEGWTDKAAPGVGPMGNVLRAGTVDLQARSWADYGAKVGAWRLLDLFDQHQVRAVFYTSGVVAHQYPNLAAEIVRRGHSLAAHGWSQGTLPAYLTEAGHALIGERIGRLTLRTESLQSAIAAPDAEAFDAASLSDYSSYCDLDAQRAVWRDLARVMRQGGRVCERKFFNKTGADLPTSFGFARDRALEELLNERDGAFFYSFVVAIRAGG